VPYPLGHWGTQRDHSRRAARGQPRERDASPDAARASSVVSCAMGHLTPLPCGRRSWSCWRLWRRLRRRISRR